MKNRDYERWMLCQRCLTDTLHQHDKALKPLDRGGRVTAEAFWLVSKSRDAILNRLRICEHEQAEGNTWRNPVSLVRPCKSLAKSNRPLSDKHVCCGCRFVLEHVALAGRPVNGM